MPFTLTMPKLSPTMEAGTITKWRKKEGEFIKEGEVIFEVATDKATVEYAVIDKGWIRKIIVQEGGEAVVNQPVAIFTEKENESIDGYQPEGVTPAKKAPAPQPEKGEAPKAQETAPVSQTAGLAQPSFKPAPPPKGVEFNVATEGYVPASPLAKKLAKEKGIDLATVPGSGPGQRVMSRDIDLGQPDLPLTFGRQEKPTVPAGSYEEEKLTPMRKAIGSRLQASKTFIPHFYVTQEIRAERLVDAHDQLKTLGYKISINDFVVRAAALALREHPQVNSGFNSETQSIIRFKTVDISIAVSLDTGLITPIVRYADFKNLGQISAEVKALAQKAKAGKLEQEEYMGGSFTISNLGMFKISEFVAVINPPQAAILAVAGVEEKPVVEEGAIVAGKTLKLTLSADHRVIDGVEGAKFLKTLQKYLENPALLVM
jgi:pyruvate dehydrogenase E2 component (dihydrolipoamide acetyltransferase)